MKYEEKKFIIGKLTGISEKTITEHLKLYAGYVKHTNLVLDKASGLLKNPDTQYTGAEMQRRLGFEFNGMRNHEIYFSLFEPAPQGLDESSGLKRMFTKQWGSIENWIENFKKLATATRGPGWAMLYYDKNSGELINAWVDEQHIGVLNGLIPILVLDMWEHAYFLDYTPADKIKYVESFFANINWLVADINFSNARK